MNRRRLLATATAGIAAALAGCTGAGGNDGDMTTAPTTTESGGTTTDSMDGTTDSMDGTTDSMDGSATVAVRSTDEYGDVLVDSEGMSLYLFTNDEENTSNCYDDCATNWPPLTVDGEPAAGDGVTASLGTTERDDGSMQVTAEGWPLYYFAGDSDPGDTTGQGVGDVWYLLAPDGSQVGGATETTTEDSAGGGY